MKKFRVWLNWEIEVEAEDIEDAKEEGLREWANIEGDGFYMEAKEIK